ncbi:hypothetical protein HWV62_5237 [Athelia sp. TMB]|nr:hypothetical protein HWV62_35814 [Athelia sp. TMB]KAF7985471.1 hypothetical protein HWV62_5237 [Athelia sp. TMB]
MNTSLDSRKVFWKSILVHPSPNAVFPGTSTLRLSGVTFSTFARTLTNAAASTNNPHLGQVEPPIPLRGLAAFRARPFLHVLSFGLVHQTIAWAALPPLFYFFQTTGAATALLAGPQFAWVLSRPVPSWLPTPFIDKKEARRKGGSSTETAEQTQRAETHGKIDEAKAGIAGAITSWIRGDKDVSRLAEAVGANKELEKMAREGKEAEARAKAKEKKPLLVEDVVEQVVRRAVRTGYNLSLSIYGQAKTRGKDGDEVADDAIKALEGKGIGGLHISNLGLGDRVRKTAEGVSFREILDGAAAYIVVKALFPARLPLSLILTPKVARVLSRVFR